MNLKSLEQRSAEIMAKAKADIVKAEQECAILACLPVLPRYVHVHSLYTSIGSAAYEVKTKQEAYEIYKQFAVIPSFVCRDTFVSIKPFDDEQAKEVCEIHAYVTCDQFGAKLEFYTSTPLGIISVDVRMPLALFGKYRSNYPRAEVHFQMEWIPEPKTNEMKLEISYSPAERSGPSSGRSKVYVMYDKHEVINQFDSSEG